MAVLLTGAVVALALLVLLNDGVAAQSPDRQIHVAPSGENVDSCGSAAHPCRTIQHAVNQAANEGWVRILVAGGVYKESASDWNPCEDEEIDAVVCIINKRVDLIGGYDRNNWASSDPTANPTVIDGENLRRGVTVLNTASSRNSLQMEGFTIRNGRAGSIPRRGGDDAIAGYGGGMFLDAAAATLKRVRFEQNTVVGVNRGSDHGGPASGGGLAVRGAPTTVELTDVDFVGNRAEGGKGETRGGYAIGGAVFTYDSEIRGRNVSAEDNVAQAGMASGSGRSSSRAMSDAQGGAFAFHKDSDVLLENVLVLNNKAVGGAAPNGSSGGAYGGGIFAELASNVVLRNLYVRGNLAQGGDGKNDGEKIGAAAHARGGGLEVNKTPLLLERFSVIENAARGGAGQRYKGSPGGGGIAFTSNDNHPAKLVNGVVANNVAAMGGGSDQSIGGGGGGLWIHGADVTLSHCTIAGNALKAGTSMSGPAVLLIESGAPRFEVVFQNSIVAQHDYSANSPAIRTKQNAKMRFENILFAENAGDNNVDGGPLSGLDTARTVASIAFVAPYAPKYDYHLSESSPAVDALSSSAISIDRDNRQRDDRPDYGAYEERSFGLSVAPAAKSRLLVRWNHYDEIASYRLTVTCEDGSRQPAEVACNAPVALTARSQYELTGLAPHASYTVQLDALDENNIVIAASQPVSAFATDTFSYIPNVSN